MTCSSLHKEQVLKRLFSSRIIFRFNEIDGTICKGFSNGNGSYSRVSGVSKGCGGRSIFTTPFETPHVKAPPKFEFRQYHRLPRQSSTRPTNVQISNPPDRLPREVSSNAQHWLEIIWTRRRLYVKVDRGTLARLRGPIRMGKLKCVLDE